MWKKGNQGEILCNNCTVKSSSGGPSGQSASSSVQQNNGGGKQVGFTIVMQTLVQTNHNTKNYFVYLFVETLGFY